MREVLENSKLEKILLVGPVPPPYGGITSLVDDLIPHLGKNYSIDIVTPSHMQKNNKFRFLESIIKQSDQNVHKYFYNFRLVSMRKLVPLCAQLLKSTSALLLSERSSSMNLLKTIALGIWNEYVITQIAKKEQTYKHVVLFGLNYIGCVPFLRKYFGASTKITLMIFAEAYKWPESYLRASSYFNQRFALLDSIFSSSDYCACSLQTVLGREEHVSTIYIGVDTTVFRPVSATNLLDRLKIPSNSKVVLALSRMNEEMGYDAVLKSAKELLAKNENLYFVMAGASGHYTEKVMEFCSNNERAICQINISIEDKVSYYAIADIFLAPTEQTHACMGVSIKEAMACSTAIVASSSGGIPEAIEHKKNGLLVGFKNKKADFDQIVDQIQYLLDNEEVASQLAKQARLDAELTFSTTAMFRKYEELFR